jgi:cyanophycin synthetase
MKKLIHKIIAKYFLPGCSDYNSVDVRRACRSKVQSREIFERNNLPYAKGDSFFTPMKAFEFANTHGFPLVIKPNVGGFSRGAHFPIKDKAHLLKASIFVKIWWPISIVEEYLLGKNYRVVVTKDGIMSILRRYPPFVTGDGKSNIEELINVENKKRQEMKLYPIVKDIPMSSPIKNYLAKQSLSLTSVLAENEKVYLHNKISLKLGSSVEIIEKDRLSSSNKEKLIKLLNSVNANILGIDVICKDGLEVDFDKQECIFLELNSRPFLAMHDKPRFGKIEDLSSFHDNLEKTKVDNRDIF